MNIVVYVQICTALNVDIRPTTSIEVFRSSSLFDRKLMHMIMNVKLKVNYWRENT